MIISDLFDFQSKWMILEYRDLYIRSTIDNFWIYDGSMIIPRGICKYILIEYNITINIHIIFYDDNINHIIMNQDIVS
jgi:hypothetical protein